MIINRQYISDKNTYDAKNGKKYIVIHETDNFKKGANGLRHAIAQSSGHLSTSVHFYCGDDGIFQTAELDKCVWAVGKKFTDNPNVKDASNYNTINIEICVNEDGNYSIARANAIELVKWLMPEVELSADRVIRHYDAKGKYCPRKMMDNPSLWEDFKKAITDKKETIVNPVVGEKKYYRVRKSWEDAKSQIGAYENFDNAKRYCPGGYTVYDWNGNAVYPIKNIEMPQKDATVLEWQNAAIADGFKFPIYGADGKWGDECRGVAKVAIIKERIVDGKWVWKYPNLTKLAQKLLGFTGDDIDGKCGSGTGNRIEYYQGQNGLKPDRCIGLFTWEDLLGV